MKFDTISCCFGLAKLISFFLFFLVISMQVSNILKAMLAFREKLPAFNVKSEFLRAVSENQVCQFLCKCSFSVFDQEPMQSELV